MASALHILGVNFLFGETSADAFLHKQPDRLIAVLAESHEARLRLSLIPLFLEHPEFSKHVRKAAQGLGKSTQVILQCYYTAAVLLQKKHCAELDLLIGKSNPSRFIFQNWDSKQQPIPNKTHLSPSGTKFLWDANQLVGTYQHAIKSDARVGNTEIMTA